MGAMERSLTQPKTCGAIPLFCPPQASDSLRRSSSSLAGFTGRGELKGRKRGGRTGGGRDGEGIEGM